MSPYLGAPIWTLTGEDRASDALPLATPAVGAVIGVILLARVSGNNRQRGPTTFSTAYPPMLVWWASWAQGEDAGILWFLAVLALCLGLVAVVRAAKPRAANELRKIAAAVAWVLSILALPVYLIGTVGLPLTVSLTIIARRRWADQRSDAKSIAADAAA